MLRNMKSKVSLNKLSEYRAVFMGLAIIFVMLCHNTLKVPESLKTTRSVLTAMCQCGVDMFMILSGLGLYYSFYKNSAVGLFWKKRITKILIPYCIAVAIYAFVYVGYLKHATLGEYLWRYSLISFYIDAELVIWFVATILTLYGIFPALYYGLQRSVKGFMWCILGVIVTCVIVSYLPLSRELIIINEIFISRVPAFMTGMIVAKILKEQKDPEISTWQVWIGFLVSGLAFVWVMLSGMGNWWAIGRLLFLPFTFCGMMLLSVALDRGAANGKKYKALAFLGGITFELYLCHERILATINDFLYLFPYNEMVLSLCSNILAIGLSIFGAWLLYKIAGFLTKGKKAKDGA